jgi:FixJ family two-component response regulator
MKENGDMPYNVFIVDDDESICRALKTLLMTCGFTVKTFNSAQSFFDAVPNDEPGCLILDIRMPVLDGWATHKIIADSGSKRPVMFISAEEQADGIDRALKVGAVGFLQKPVDGEVLVQLIEFIRDYMCVEDTELVKEAPDAESTGGETQKGSKQAQGVEQGT